MASVNFITLRTAKAAAENSIGNSFTYFHISTFQVQQQHHVKSSSSVSRGFPSPVVIPPTPVSTSQTPSSAPLTAYQDPLTSEEVSKEDETLKMLQRHYLQAILTLAPPHKLSVSCIIELFKERYVILVSIKF